MKKTLLISIFLLSSSPILADQYNDFGLRVETGATQVVKNVSHSILGISTDSFLFSDTIRMSFGVTFLFPMSSNIGTLGLQYIGIETAQNWFNVPFLLGLRLQKSYIKVKTNGLKSQQTIAINVAKKFKLSKNHDWLLNLSWSPNPFQSKTASLTDSTWIIKTGLEWYF